MPEISTWISGLEIGARLYDAVTRNSAPLNRHDYIKAYVESLNGAIEIMPSLHALEREKLERCTHELLKSTALVVKAYHQKDDVRILSNYMVAESPSDVAVATAKFCDRTRRADSFEGFLRLVAWSDTDDTRLPQGLLLPLEFASNETACLCGAPRAYQSAQPQIVDDTLDYSVWSDCEQEAIRVEQREYFKKHKEVLRSFVSFPVPLATPEGRRLNGPPEGGHQRPVQPEGGVRPVQWEPAEVSAIYGTIYARYGSLYRPVAL